MALQPDISDPSNPGNKHRTRESRRQLRELLLAWDPIGVAGISEADDEYDCLLSPLMHRLHDGASVAEVRDWLIDELEEHFGMLSDPVRELDVALQVRVWWHERLTEPPPG